MSLPIAALSSPLTVWRLVREIHANTAFTGDGAKKHGGRWNTKGHAAVYTSSSISLALLEMLVQADLLPAYTAIPVTLPERTPCANIAPGQLPAEWRDPIAPEALKNKGSTWITEAQTSVLCVPSAVLPNEKNYILNPAHPDFATLSVGQAQQVQLDSRLLAVFRPSPQ